VQNLCSPTYRNKKGLLKATNNLANEIMLLGVASLVLMACTPTLTRVCTPKAHTFRPWLDNVKPCACCLSRTKGVSPCFLKASAWLAPPHLPLQQHAHMRRPVG